MADKTVMPKWLGYQILDNEHAQDLEQRAAVHEIERKLPRTEAERQAHIDYQKEHHAKAAAHHLMGMKAAQGSGHMDAARKHGAMYALHVKELGEDSYGPVPEAVKMHADAPERKQVYNFKAHKGDAFLFQKEGEPVAKSEEPSTKGRYKMGYCASCRRETVHDHGWCRACPKPVDAKPREAPAVLQRSEPVTFDRLHTLYRAIKALLAIHQ